MASPSHDPNDVTSSPVDEAARTGELVRDVLIEAFGSSFTPFVPLPFVDDYLFARLLRRIARKVIERAQDPRTKADDRLPIAVTDAYLAAGDTGIGQKALTLATRFVIRKVAVVLDVKRSHDVFGESIAFALALDVAVRAGALDGRTASPIGAAIHRATQSVGSAALELLTRAAREAFAGPAIVTARPAVVNGAFEDAPVSASRPRGVDDPPESSRFARVGSAIGRHVDETRKHLEHLMTYEITQLPREQR